MQISGIDASQKQQYTMNTDSVSRSIQNQIESLKQQLESLSENEEMDLTEKAKQKEELNTQITELENQLQQHKAEQRQNSRQSSNQQASGREYNRYDHYDFSENDMKQIISADVSMERSNVLNSTAEGLKGRNEILKSEIKLDSSRGGSTERKQEELAENKSRISGIYSRLGETAKTVNDNNRTDAENVQADSAANEETDTESDAAGFKNIDELASYLYDNYDVVKKGMAEISASYLNDCLNDSDKLNDLYNMLEAADSAYADAQENVKGFQSMKVTIDKDGNMTYETSGGSVTVNEGKRARQIAAAASPEQLQMVMGLLNQDLSDCKNGVQNGMCDDSEVAKVESLIQRAQQRMAEVQSGGEPKSSELNAFYLNMLM